MEHLEVSVVVAYEMVRYEESHCLCSQRRVEVFDFDVLGKVPLQGMVDIRVQEEEEVMWTEKEGEMALGQG